MIDRLTQTKLLPHGRPPRGWDAVTDWSQRFHRAYETLPQVRGVRIGWRWTQAACDKARAFVWGRILGPLLYMLLQLLLLPFHAFWRWFCHTALARATVKKWIRFRKAVLDLPQHRFAVRVHRFMHPRPLLRVLILQVILIVIALPYCTEPISEYTHNLYLMVDNDGPTVVGYYPTEDYSGEKLTTYAQHNEYFDAPFVLSARQDVVVMYNDETMIVESRRETVENLLRRLEITPEADEMIAINIAGAMPLIHISDELHYQRSEIVPVSYTTKEVYNYLVPKNTRSVVRQGQDGTIKNTYDDIYRMGKVVSSVLIDRTDNTSVTEIIEVGSLVHSVEFDDKMTEAHAFLDGREGGYLVFESGDSMVYTKKVVCNTTAYYSGGEHGAAWTTATGHSVGYGIIAADPNVFPYHSHLYVSGYGYSQIEDCGGFRGNALDVWYSSYAECARWGRRYVTCYVVE